MENDKQHLELMAAMSDRQLPEHLESLIGCDGEMHCLRCGLVLLVTDRVCPVCGHDHEMQVAMHAKLRTILEAAWAVGESRGAGEILRTIEILTEALADD